MQSTTIMPAENILSAFFIRTHICYSADVILLFFFIHNNGLYNK